MALNDQNLDGPEEIVDTARLLALSDGIFAIAATLLVLNLHPDLPFFGTGGSIGAISAYVLSFVIVGTYWLGHHRMFSFIQRADAWLLRLNIAFLFFVSALPFVTAVLNDDKVHHYDGTQVYAGTLALMSLLELAMWLYACTGRRLVPADLSRRVVISSASFMIAAAAIFASSIPIASFVDVNVAKFWWLLLIPIGAVLRRMFRTRGMTYEPSSASASSPSPSPRSTTRA